MWMLVPSSFVWPKARNDPLSFRGWMLEQAGQNRKIKLWTSTAALMVLSGFKLRKKPFEVTCCLAPHLPSLYLSSLHFPDNVFFFLKEIVPSDKLCIFSSKGFISYRLWTSLVSQMVNNLSATQEIWVQSLGQEDFLEKELATHSSILAWRIS